MYMITFEQYVADGTAHFDKIRAKPKGTIAQRPSVNRWNVSYV